MDYDEIVEAIEKAPLTWLPAIMLRTVKTVIAKKVFADGGLERTLATIIQKPEVVLADSTGLLVRIPCTKDGKPILWGDTVFITNPDGAPWEGGYVLPVKVESIIVGCHFEEYDGTHTIMGGDNECGNLECYSASELVPAEY